MRTNPKMRIWLLPFGIVAAITCGGVLAVPTAHAKATCTVPAAHLELHDSGGYDISVEAIAGILGPTAAVRVTPELISVGRVTGGFNDHSIDFVMNWSGTESSVYFTGTVGNDGVARGTSTGISYPVKLDPGSLAIHNSDHLSRLVGSSIPYQPAVRS